MKEFIKSLDQSHNAVKTLAREPGDRDNKQYYAGKLEAYREMSSLAYAYKDGQEDRIKFLSDKAKMKSHTFLLAGIILGGIVTSAFYIYIIMPMF